MLQSIRANKHTKVAFKTFLSCKVHTWEENFSKANTWIWYENVLVKSSLCRFLKITTLGQDYLLPWASHWRWLPIWNTKRYFFLPIKQTVKFVALMFPGFCKAPTRHYNHGWNSGDPTPGCVREWQTNNWSLYWFQQFSPTFWSYSISFSPKIHIDSNIH